jgi:P-type E1-E2 ATPase
MEQIGTSTLVAFDKTGTLTEGTPSLTTVRLIAGADSQLSEEELLGLAAAVENPSEHPLARAVVEAARQAGLTVAPAEEFTAVPGRGVRARVGGRLVEVGSPGHLGCGRDRSSRTEVAELEEGGQTAVVVRVDGRVAGVLGLSDRLRTDATEAVAGLTSLLGARPVLVTGDNPRAAARLAGQAGIDDVRAGLLPQDKVDTIRALQATGDRVLLVGDGINDAPALATAHASVAMGRVGSDLALQTADAVIVRDELTAVPALIGLSRHARRLVRANLIIAAIFIAVLAAWDLLGHLPLPLGVAGHEGSTVIVGLNGLRPLSRATWRPTTGISAR